MSRKRPVYRAYRQLDFLIPLVWQCTFIEPAKGIFDLVGELEAGEKSHNQGIVSVTHTPGFPPADIAQCGPALVVYGHDKEAVEAAAEIGRGVRFAEEAHRTGHPFARRDAALALQAGFVQEGFEVFIVAAGHRCLHGCWRTRRRAGARWQ